LGATTDAITQIGKVCGDSVITVDGFVPLLNKLIANYLRGSSPISDKVMVLGCFSELFKSCKATIPIVFQKVFPHALKFCQEVESVEEDLEIIRNCSFLIGILFDNALPIVLPHLASILPALQKCYLYVENMEAHVDVRDNILAALSRVIINAHQSFPFEQALPIIMDKIPFNGDPQENLTVLKLILFLQQHKPATLNISNISNVILSCLKIIIDDKSDFEAFAKQEAASFIKNHIAPNAQYAPILEAFASGMSEKEKIELRKFI